MARLSRGGSSIVFTAERRRRQKRVRAKRRWSSSSPSPPRAEGLKKSICFWGYNEQRETEWYVFKVSDMKKNGFIMTKDKYTEKGLKKIRKTNRLPEGIALLPRHLHLGENMGELIPFSCTPCFDIQRGRCVAIGSVIYRCGGDDNYVDSVVCFDLDSRGGGGWRNCPPMRNKRYMTRALALDGKLYVMGGCEIEHSGPWAEVYDPCLEIWESLPPPPSQSPDYPQFVVAVEASKKILVIFDDSWTLFHAYDLTSDSWEIIHCLPDDSSDDRASATVVDHTVYYIKGDMLRALDLKRRKWFRGTIKGLEEDFVIQHSRSACVFPTLFHLSGDKFCVFYVDSLTDTILSHSVNIRISKSNDRVLDVYFESCQSYKIDSHFTCMDATLLDGRFISGKRLADESSSTKVVSKIEGGKLKA